jgi:hypothetical protein
MILTGFTVGLTKLIVTTNIFLFGWLYLPLFILIVMFSIKLYEDYTR